MTKIQTGVGVAVRDVMTNTYTANEQLASMTDAEANKATYAYDGSTSYRKPVSRTG